MNGQSRVIMGTPKKPFDPNDPERADLAKMLAREVEIIRAMPLTREALTTIDSLASHLYTALPTMSQEEAGDILDRISKLAMTALAAAATDIRLTAAKGEQRKARKAVTY